MLPHPRQVGESQIDHLDLPVLDRLHQIFGCRTLRNHGFTPVMESLVLKIVSLSGRFSSGAAHASASWRLQYAARFWPVRPRLLLRAQWRSGPLPQWPWGHVPPAAAAHSRGFRFLAWRHAPP